MDPHSFFLPSSEEMSAFAVAPHEAWQFEGVEGDRARLLGETPFEHIVPRIGREARLESFGWNPGEAADTFVGKAALVGKARCQH